MGIGGLVACGGDYTTSTMEDGKGIVDGAREGIDNRERERERPLEGEGFNLAEDFDVPICDSMELRKHITMSVSGNLVTVKANGSNILTNFCS